MNIKLVLLIISLYFSCATIAQTVEVQANYNASGDVDFIAYNNTKVPLFVYLNFGDLSNAMFNEPLPYVKLITPGYNDLFMLQRDVDAEAPRFTYEVDQLISNPYAEIDLDFPYLLPFQPSTIVQSVAIENFQHQGKAFFADYYPTIFKTTPNTPVYAVRNGIVTTVKRDDALCPSLYPGLQNSITVLQPDGTLLTYQNIQPDKLKEGDKIYAGKPIGKLLPNDSTLILFVTQSQLSTNELMPIIPKFQINATEIALIIGQQKYTVVHPKSVCGREMTRREKRKHLK